MWPGSRTGTTSRPGPGPHLWTPPPGEQIRHRLSRAGNRRLNHVLHMATIAQIRLDTEGRTYYRRKLAEAKTRKEARRCLKRRLSDMVYRQLVADANLVEDARALAVARGVEAGPGGQSGAVYRIQRGRPVHPGRRLFGSATTRTRSPDATRPTTPSDTTRGLGSPATTPTRRSRQRGAPHRTNDVDGDKRRRTLQGAEAPPLTTEGNRKDSAHVRVSQGCR